MEGRIFAHIPHDDKKKQEILIYGYATRGIPGFDIVGPPMWSRPLKGKLIFLTRFLNLRLPARRYVVGLDHFDFHNKKNLEHFRYAELSTLILYWWMGGVFKLKNPENIHASGSVSVSGEIYVKEFALKNKSVVTQIDPEIFFMEFKALRITRG